MKKLFLSSSFFQFGFAPSRHYMYVQVIDVVNSNNYIYSNDVFGHSKFEKILLLLKLLDVSDLACIIALRRGLISSFSLESLHHHQNSLFHFSLIEASLSKNRISDLFLALISSKTLVLRFDYMEII